VNLQKRCAQKARGSSALDWQIIDFCLNAEVQIAVGFMVYLDIV
jgi:hypothetical protein